MRGSVRMSRTVDESRPFVLAGINRLHPALLQGGSEAGEAFGSWILFYQERGGKWRVHPHRESRTSARLMDATALPGVVSKGARCGPARLTGSGTTDVRISEIVTKIYARAWGMLPRPPGRTLA